MDLVTVHRIVILFEQYFYPVMEFRDRAIPEKAFQREFKTLPDLLILFTAQTLLYPGQVIEDKRTEFLFSCVTVSALIIRPAL